MMDSLEMLRQAREARAKVKAHALAQGWTEEEFAELEGVADRIVQRLIS
jgi:hypothetical protein